MKRILIYIWLFLCLSSLCYRPYLKTTYKVENEDKIYLSIPNTSFLEEVVQASDNTYYLTHDKEGNKSPLGAIFLDYRTKINDTVSIIYGHNSMTYDVPFRLLNAYYEEDYFRTHDKLILEKGKNVYTYQIFSCFIAYQDFFFVNLPKTEEEFLNYVQKLKNNSWYNTTYIPKKEDHLLVLQTCSYHPKYKHYKEKYILITARLVDK